MWPGDLQVVNSSDSLQLLFVMKILNLSNFGYRYAMMELGLDPPDLPMGMLSDVHLKRCKRFKLLLSPCITFLVNDTGLGQVKRSF